MPRSGQIVKTFGGSKALTRSPCGKGQLRPSGETGTQNPAGTHTPFSPSNGGYFVWVRCAGCTDEACLAMDGLSSRPEQNNQREGTGL